MTVIPMDCLAVETIPREDNLIYELKFDGVRAIVLVGDGKVEIHHSESPNVVNFKYPSLVSELEKLKPGIYDGELCVLDGEGISNISAMQSRAHVANKRRIQLYEEKYPVKFMCFDMLSQNGSSIKTEYLIDRKKKLEDHLKLLPLGSPIRLVPYYPVPDALEKLYERIEGIVIKGMYSIYEEGKRSGAWRKKRFIKEESVKVVSFEDFTRKAMGDSGVETNRRIPAGTILTTSEGRRVPLPGIARAEHAKSIIANYGHAMADIQFYEKTPDGYRFPVVKRVYDPETKRGIEEP
jgi:ATP-dependent DNA ligase